MLFIDDGSSDGSSDILDGLAARYRMVKVFYFDRNYGQSAAFDAGFKQSTGELVMTIDGDLQNDPADIAVLLPHIRTFDLVCGWRKDRHDNLTRKISSRIANAVRSSVTGDRVHDTGCSLKLFRRAVVEKLPDHADVGRDAGDGGHHDVVRHVFAQCEAPFCPRAYGHRVPDPQGVEQRRELPSLLGGDQLDEQLEQRLGGRRDDRVRSLETVQSNRGVLAGLERQRDLRLEPQTEEILGDILAPHDGRSSQRVRHRCARQL